jgi:hypothetical protein
MTQIGGEGELGGFRRGLAVAGGPALQKPSFGASHVPADYVFSF